MGGRNMQEPNCPGCQKVMTISDAEERTWKCADCRLTWIPRRSLALSLPEDQLPRISQRAISAPACGRRLICPSCETPSFRTLSLRSIDFEHCYRQKLLFCESGGFLILGRLGDGAVGGCPVSGRIPCLEVGHPLTITPARGTLGACCWLFPATGAAALNAW